MDGYTGEKQIYTEVVQSNIEYDEYREWIEMLANGYMTVNELDEIVGMIVRAICSRKPVERICGQDFPREVIKSAMLKVDRTCLENAIETMKQTDNIRNYERYLISTLFNEANGRHFKENAEGRNIVQKSRANCELTQVIGFNNNIRKVLINMILIVGEKPSVSRAISSVVGADVTKKGYSEGNGYIVSWCFGHLVGLKYPNDYNNGWQDK